MPVLTWSVLPGLEATGMLPELAKIVEDGQKRRKKEPEQPPMTLFAPTDSAFAQLPEDCLFADCQSASRLRILSRKHAAHCIWTLDPQV